METEFVDRAERAALLTRAVCSNDFARGKALLEREPELARLDVYVASACGELHVVQEALAADRELAKRAGGADGWPPLVYACFSRFWRQDAERAARLLEVAQLLLEHGADPNAYYLQEHDGRAVPQTCLFAAAGIANSASLTRSLLEAGANVDEEVLPRSPDAAPPTREHFQAWLDQHPMEALYHASEFKDVTCLRLLLEAKPAYPAVTYCLSRALDFDSEEATLLYLGHGADARHVVPWHQQRSHLHKAVVNRRSMKVIRALLAGGADPNLPDAHGLTPYRLAVRRGAHDIAQILLESGADPTTLRSEDSAPPPDPDLLIQAARRGDLAELERWLNAGADPNAALDMAPLHGACYAGQLDAGRLLLDRGASLTQRNIYGGAALDTCIYGSTDCHDEEGGPSARLPEEVPPRGYAELTELLIQRGAVLPTSIRGGSEAVKDVLRRRGVPD